jgi:hypothetical protein
MCQTTPNFLMCLLNLKFPLFHYYHFVQKYQRNLKLQVDPLHRRDPTNQMFH